MPLEAGRPSTGRRSTVHRQPWWRPCSQEAPGAQRLHTDPSVLRVRGPLVSPSEGCEERCCGVFKGVFGSPQ